MTLKSLAIATLAALPFSIQALGTDVVQQDAVEKAAQEMQQTEKAAKSISKEEAVRIQETVEKNS